MGPSSFVPQSSVRPSKLAPQCLVALSFASYFSAATSGYSSAAVVKMVVIFVAKGKWTFHEVHQFPYHPILMTQHVSLTYSDDKENEVEENPEEDPEEDFAEKTEATGSPLHSNASSQSEEF